MSFAVGSRVFYRGQAEYPHGTVLEVLKRPDGACVVRWDFIGPDRLLYLADELRPELANAIPGGQPNREEREP